MKISSSVYVCVRAAVDENQRNLSSICYSEIYTTYLKGFCRASRKVTAAWI